MSETRPVGQRLCRSVHPKLAPLTACQEAYSGKNLGDLVVVMADAGQAKKPSGIGDTRFLGRPMLILRASRVSDQHEFGTVRPFFFNECDL
jgi:hypothetical protein